MSAERISIDFWSPWKNYSVLVYYYVGVHEIPTKQKFNEDLIPGVMLTICLCGFVKFSECGDTQELRACNEGYA